jgi:cytochrome c peroxidase
MRHRTVLLCGRRLLTNGRVVVRDRPRVTSSQVALGARLVMRIARRCRWSAWLCLVLFLAFGGTVVRNGVAAAFTPAPTIDPQPITPILQPPAADPLKLALGESLFQDHRLSHDGTLACASCHDLHTNGADDNQRRTARNGSTMPFTVLSVFNAALNFRLNWEGNYRSLEAQAQSSLENPANMATSIDEVVAKLKADPKIVEQFVEIYGHQPDRASLLDALATYERSLLTPGSRFDRWLQGDTAALTAEELSGYRLFQSLGCISCHQGVNIGGNLYERHGIFHRLASPNPEILRVPSLRNVAVMAPYFQDGSSPTLQDAVRKMAEAQLDLSLSDQQIAMIVSFLDTLTGRFHGVPVTAPPR